MLLIDEKNKVHVNEKARTVLKNFWNKSYEHNMISKGFLSVAGLRYKVVSAQT